MNLATIIILSLLLLISLLANIHFIRKKRTIDGIDGSGETPDPSTDTQLSAASLDVKDKTHQSLDVDSLSRFVRLHKDISDEIEFLDDSNCEAESLNEILNLLTQALNDCGVKTFSPSVGESFRTAFGVAPNPEFVVTSNRNDAWKIARVISLGFCTTSPRRYCLKEATVSVFKYDPSG